MQKKDLLNNQKFPLMTWSAILFFTEPVLKVLTLKAQTDFPWNTLLENLQSHSSNMDAFQFWGVPLACGLLFYLSRFHSALRVMAWLGWAAHWAIVLTYESYTWPYLSATPPITTLVILIASGLALGSTLFTWPTLDATLPAKPKPSWVVLLVEANSLKAQTQREFWVRAGARTLLAHDSYQALQIARLENPDLIISGDGISVDTWEILRQSYPVYKIQDEASYEKEAHSTLEILKQRSRQAGLST